MFSLFSVNVPVLSEQITVIPDNSSSELNFLTTTPSFASLIAPIAIIVASTAGIAAGIEATKSVSASIAVSVSEYALITLIKIIIKIPKKLKNTRYFPIFKIDLSRLLVGLSSCISWAVFPNVVFIPVNITIPFACPRCTCDDEYAVLLILQRTGKLSPVRVD